jgi:single-strand DNA-binding protein
MATKTKGRIAPDISEVEDEAEGTTFKHRIAEVHASNMKRLSKIETADDPA